MFFGSHLHYDVFMSQKIVFILANSAYPDEMPHYAEFWVGLFICFDSLRPRISHVRMGLSVLNQY